MTLSDIIIYGTEQQVREALQHPNAEKHLNLVDEYGYTPLIQALIANDTAKAKLILEYPVDVNLKDITNRYPLHWAAENSNFELAKLLLEKGADPNTYNFSGESVLVKPLLRQQRDFVKLLWEHGVNTTFAYDYINAKSIGHQFELVGSVDIATPKNIFTEIDYEGFYFEFSLDLVAYNIDEYMKNYAARDVRPWMPRLQVIYEALRNATQLIQYDHYMIEAKKFKKEIELAVNRDPLVIPVSQQGHAITLVRHKNLFAICDRANIENDAGLTIYYMNRSSQLNYERIFDWVYNKQELKIMYRTLPAELGLKPIASIPLTKQRIGNCSWANVEATVPVLYYMLQTNDPSNKLPAEDIQTDAMDIYYRWREWTKERTLQQMIHAFAQASRARRASKAASLAAVLFQTCSADNVLHLERAKRILAVLKTPGYEYILESYIKYYVHNKPTKAGKNLQRLLEIYEREAL